MQHEIGTLHIKIELLDHVLFWITKDGGDDGVVISHPQRELKKLAGSFDAKAISFNEVYEDRLWKNSNTLRLLSHEIISGKSKKLGFYSYFHRFLMYKESVDGDVRMIY